MIVASPDGLDGLPTTEDHPTVEHVHSVRCGGYLTVWSEAVHDMVHALNVYVQAGWRLHTWQWGHQNQYGFVPTGWTAVLERPYELKPQRGRPRGT